MRNVLKYLPVRRQPARLVRASAWRPAGLTVRLVIDLGRTQSMMCHPAY